ncbi:MAG: EutN/CcmL family microcompartment protein [Gemmatimonadota bacterium]
MHLARVLGRLVSTVKQQTLTAIPLQWIQPITASGDSAGKPIVAVDRIGSGPGDVVVYITSREAAMTLEDPFAAVDAGIVAKVDWCNLRQERTLDA